MKEKVRGDYVGKRRGEKRQKRNMRKKRRQLTDSFTEKAVNGDNRRRENE